MDDLKNNPHYINGRFLAKSMIKFIHTTTYGTLENAILKKKELVEDLKENFGWDENVRDVGEALGMIAAMEEALEEQNKKDV